MINTVAKGALTDLPEAQVRILVAAGALGRITRGAIDPGLPVAPLTVLQSMAKRGYVTLTGAKYRPDGAVMTELGRRRVARALAEQAEADRLAAAARGM